MTGGGGSRGGGGGGGLACSVEINRRNLRRDKEISLTIRALVRAKCSGRGRGEVWEAGLRQAGSLKRGTGRKINM